MLATPTPKTPVVPSVPDLSMLSTEQLTEMALHFGFKLAGALVVLYIGLYLVKWVARALSRAMTRAHVEPTAMQFMSRLTYVVLVVLLVLAILQIFFAVQPNSILAILGAAGLAIGLALKDSLSNVASGVMLVTLKPFRVGDIVQIGGSSGKVEAVSIFQTRLRGADNQTIVLPNNLITTAPIINLTPDKMRRIELIIGIGYTDDLDAAREAIMKIMRADQRILSEPAPDVMVYELADTAVRLGVRCHVSNADHFATRCELNERIKRAFDEAGISIQGAQRDVRAVRTITQDGATGITLTVDRPPS